MSQDLANGTERLLKTRKAPTSTTSVKKIAQPSLREIETEVTEFMMEEKKKYVHFEE